MKRKNGISLLLATQNVERTVSLCIESFKEFADEIIVVDNGSTDNTISIVQELASRIKKIKFYNAPWLVDLYHNRQYAFERSQYNWVLRGDADFIAHTDGPNNIMNLREYALGCKRSLRPISIGVPTVNLIGDYNSTGMNNNERGLNKSANKHEKVQGHYIPQAITQLNNRLIQVYPFMKFIRRGRWEGININPRLLNKVFLDTVYWFHCEFKTKRDCLLRSERTNWRQLGDYKKFPTLKDYLKSVLEEKYGTKDIHVAADRYYSDQVEPFVVPFSEKKYGVYPALIKTILEKC